MSWFRSGIRWKMKSVNYKLWDTELKLRGLSRHDGCLCGLGWVKISFLIEIGFIRLIYGEVESEVIERTNKYY